jgi:hypothetical protein
MRIANLLIPLFILSVISSFAAGSQPENDRDQYKAVLDALFDQYKVRDDQSIKAIRKTAASSFEIDLVYDNGDCLTTPARVKDVSLKVDFPKVAPYPCNSR